MVIMKKGFTLLELTLSISIMLLVFSGLVFPFKNYSNIFLEHSKNMLISDLKLSKIMAYSKGVEVTFAFIKDDKSNDYIGYNVSQGLKFVKKAYFPKDIIISKSLSTIPTSGLLTFNSNGSVSPYACTIVLINKKTNMTKKITLTIGFTRITDK